MIRVFASGFAIGTLMASAASATSVGPVQWTTDEGGNGNFYQVVESGPDGYSWDAANAMAQERTFNGLTGQLATITSAEEQTFVDDVVGAFATSSDNHPNEFVQAWLGASDAEDEGTWQWVTGEDFSYTNWANGQPDNAQFQPEGQDYLLGWWPNGTSNRWDDCGLECSGNRTFKAVVEYENPNTAPVPVPASLPLAVAGLGALGLVARRRKAA